MWLIIPIIFAILNRARGSKLFDHTKSTQVSRIVSTCGMALVVLAMTLNLSAFLWAWASLFFWSLPGWGKYAGAAIGAGLKDETEFPPVDWAMRQITIRNPRIWGGVAMGLRMLLAAPCLIGLAYLCDGNYWPALLTPLMGLIYTPCGYIFGMHGWKAGEYISGFVLGFYVVLSANL